jgi:hypothetical protein
MLTRLMIDWRAILTSKFLVQLSRRQFPVVFGEKFGMFVGY